MITQIESADNKHIKCAKKLYLKKNRDKSGQYIIEGINLVSEALRRNENIDFILYQSGNCVLPEIETAIKSGVKAYEVSPHVFEEITDAENGVKVLAVVNKPSMENGFLSDVLDAINPEDNVLILDRLQDPGNVGTIIRTAEATGYAMIIVLKGTVDVYSPKVLRSTAGSIYAQPIICLNDVAELKVMLDRLEKITVVTSVNSGKPYYHTDLSRGIALVIGNEGNGVSDEISEIADIKTTIPMKGNIESLNAAISASLLMYESIRKNN